MSGMLPGMDSDISVELPFKLMHARPPPKQRKPHPEPPTKEMSQLSVNKPKEPDAQSVNLISFESTEKINTGVVQQHQQQQHQQQQPQQPAQEDFIFEDFARMRHLQTQNSQDELK